MKVYPNKKGNRRIYLAEYAIPEGLVRLRGYIKDLEKLEAEWERHTEKKRKKWEKRLARIQTMRKRGLSMAAIGRKEGVTRERIRQILKGTVK